MLTSVPIQDQYAAAEKDEIKILIIGAGIAGVSAAQMLRKEGRHPVLVERNADNDHPGYMLALMPMADRLLDDLGVHELYRENSVRFDKYGLHGHSGKLIRVDEMGRLLSPFGEYRGISRGKLLNVLSQQGCDVSFDTTVAEMDINDHQRLVKLKTDGVIRDFIFDLVIVADGVHSGTRKYLIEQQEVNQLNTHWGGWVIWTPEDEAMELGEEIWGAGFFMGIYPVKEKLGVFIGGHQKDTKKGPQDFILQARKKLKVINPRFEKGLKALEQTESPFYWALDDCRCSKWAFDKAILLGDAAVGFLPTAGIGAGMAMESAWVLTRLLQKADKKNLNLLLQAFESAQKSRVQSAQDNSRQLAKMMFNQSTILANLRDLAMRFVGVQTVLKPIKRILENLPDPDRIARQALADKL